MTKLKTLCASGALLLGSSTLALAITITPPPSGSHPEMVDPQNAPDSWAVERDPGTTSATAPAPQTASSEFSAPESGSHPEMLVPQNAPDSRAMETDDGTVDYQTSQQLARQDQASQIIQSAVRRQIENAGYSSVYGVVPSLDGYRARAVLSGQRVTVDVDSDGNVRVESNQH